MDLRRFTDAPWTFFPSSGLCRFPVAAVTDYHKPGELKQQKLILLHIWRLEVKNQDVSGAPLSLKVLGENLSVLLPGSGGSSVPWLRAA